MPTTLCPTPEELKAFCLGYESDHSHDEMAQHISGCTDCQSQFERFDHQNDPLISALRNADPEVAFDSEPACELGIARALGALAKLDEDQTAPEMGSGTNELPASIGEYEILQLLGSGGMGRVYLARHQKLGRLVAAKVLGNHRLGDVRARQRFEAEMRAVGGLSHPNIVIAHDAREIDGHAVLVTEFIDGIDLGQLVQRRGPLPLADACEIARQIAMALQFTSEAGFVHRDVKPSNIMLSRNGEVKLLDLGLARASYPDPGTPEVTYTGQTLGTADYISPEQVTDSRQVDVRADIYSLGATLTKLLTGCAPFADDKHATAFAKLTAHVSETPKSVRSKRADIPVEIERLVSTMLSKHPADRPQTPLEVEQKLTPFCAGSDLKLLVHESWKLHSPIGAAEGSTTSDKVAPSTSVSPRWPTRTYATIAAGFMGFLLGLFFGIVITITHRDGTTSTLSFPSAQKIEITESPADDNLSNKTSDSNLNSATVDLDIAIQQSSSPLAFGVLVRRQSDGKGPTISDEKWQKLQDLLHQSRHDVIVKTEGMQFVPVSSAMDGETSITAWNNGVRYALIATDPEYALPWEDLAGKIVECESAHDAATGQGTLSLKFDDATGKKLRRITSMSIGLQLGVVIDGVLVQAPRILHAIDGNAQITGHFSAKQMQNLRQVLIASQAGLSSKVKTSTIPQVETVKIYQLNVIQAEIAYRMLSVHLASTKSVRMEIDQKTNSLIVQASPATHDSIEFFLKAIDSQDPRNPGEEFEVVSVKMEVPLAIRTIKKFFGSENDPSKGPIVDGDIAKGQLYIKGTPQQIEQVKKLLEKMTGESGEQKK